MSKLVKQILILICLITVLILPYFVFAQKTTAPLGKLGEVAVSGGFQKIDTRMAVSGMIGQIITAVLSLLGVIFLILTIYGGFLWMTAGGQEEQVTKAKNILTRAVIGLIIVIAAYAITWFVFTYIIKGMGALRE